MPRRAAQTRTVTIQIIVRAMDHDLSAKPEQEAQRLKRGDIVACVLTPPRATRNNGDWHWDEPINLTGRLAFVHMKELPDAKWPGIQFRFLEGLTGNNESAREDPNRQGRLARQRRWRFDVPGLQANRPAKHSELMNNGETTLTWTQARQYIHAKRFTDMNDPDQDTYTPVEDEDLPELTP